LTYQVLTACRVREQLDGAPPELRAFVDGIVAFLRVDPAAASVAFVLLGGSDCRTIIFAQGRGFSATTSSSSNESWSWFI